ncbi:diguanylate cyclase [Pseudoroseicyclus sp. H15]
MALATMIYGVLQRRPWPKWQRHSLIGLAFGTAGAVGMLEPIELIPGVIADPRNLFVAFAAGFLGPLGAAIATVITVAMRVAIGGAGAPFGVVSIVLAALIGLILSLPAVRRGNIGLTYAVIFGAAINLPNALVFAIPNAPFVTGVEIFVGLMVFNVLGTVTFGLFIERERLISRRERTLVATADHDPLTGSLNRRGLDRRLAALTESEAQGTALLLVDLDRFKQINDRYGHVVGDEVLVQVAATLERALRPGDLVARIGGEEFSILLQDVTEGVASRVAERLRQTIEETVVMAGGVRVEVTASIGGAFFGASLPALGEAMPMVDRRLYAAKAGGRNRTVMSEAA